MLILHNIDNSRCFELYDEKINYINKLTSLDSRLLETDYFRADKILVQSDSEFICNTIKRILNEYTLYDICVNGVEIPVFNPTVFELGEEQYYAVPIKHNNLHFIDCLMDFLSRSSCIVIREPSL